MSVIPTPCGTAATGDEIDLFAVTNRSGVKMELLNLGATLKALAVPDRNGTPANVVLGFGDPARYESPHPYFGSTVGRFANRIANAAFRLDGVTVRLAANDPPHHLHGGERGFARVVWAAVPFETESESGVRFTYHSPDRDDRYPGTLDVEAEYALTDEDEVRISFVAVADAPTPVNLTNHAYWNLSGEPTIRRHELQIEADHFLPVDAGQIPTGAIVPVAETPMDFTRPKPVGRDMERVPGPRAGYDVCFVLRHRAGVAAAARLYDPVSGRLMEVSTTQPGLQLYTGNNLSGRERDGGYEAFAGLCLETQHFPDSPNQPHFPTTVLEPGERLAEVTIFRFSVVN